MPASVPLDRVLDNPSSARTVYDPDGVAELGDAVDGADLARLCGWDPDEAHAVEVAAVAVLATIPEPARALLTPLLCATKDHVDPAEAAVWAEAAGRASFREYVLDESPRGAAEACGLEIDWPDVSADTPGDGAAQPSATRPAQPAPEVAATDA